MFCCTISHGDERGGGEALIFIHEEVNLIKLFNNKTNDTIYSKG
jgi:hypothetical protein